MNNETFAYFKILNHTNQLGVSSYALPFCVYKFIVEFGSIETGGVLSNKQILWNFGDGTTSTELTGTHAYKQPGTYQVTCYLYDNNGNAYINTYARDVIVYNYITDKISVTTDNTLQYYLTAGQISAPLLIKRTNSYQSYADGMEYTIVPYASGSNISQNYFNRASSLLYGHMEKYNAFYIEQDTPSGNIELVETSRIITPGEKIYCKYENGEVIHTTENDEYAFFCGTSGERIVYFKEDMPSSSLSNYIFSTGTFTFFDSVVQDRDEFSTIIPYMIYTYEFDTNGIYTRQIGIDISQDQSINAAIAAYVATANQLETEYYFIDNLNRTMDIRRRVGSLVQGPLFIGGSTNNALSGLWNVVRLAPDIILQGYIKPINLYFGFESDVFDVNTSTVGLSCIVLPNTDYNSVSITSNGIDGEGTRLSTFNLTNNKFVGQKTSFIIKVKDRDWFTIKDINISNYTNVLRTATSTLSATFYIQSSSNGYLKGYVIPHAQATNAYIHTTLTLSSVSNKQNISGSSDTFDILNTYTSIAKRGEDIDMLDKYKSLRFQELFFDKLNLFDNFLGTIVGTISSSQDSIGKKVYEKITNFVDNNSNIEKCNISQLISILQSIDEQNITFERLNFNYPVSLKRLIDILSIKHSKLFGARNTFDLDFYNHGNQLQGNNLGDRIIDTTNYTISAGRDLVALEKYSGTFKKLNTYTPLSAASLSGVYTTKYPLSTYNNDWGWYLILNDDFVFNDIDKYYIFFNHNSHQNDIEESVINFNDGNTTLFHTTSSYNDWKADNGIIDNLISYELARGLGLISSLSS